MKTPQLHNSFAKMSIATGDMFDVIDDLRRGGADPMKIAARLEMIAQQQLEAGQMLLDEIHARDEHPAVEPEDPYEPPHDRETEAIWEQAIAGPQTDEILADKIMVCELDDIIAEAALDEVAPPPPSAEVVPFPGPRRCIVEDRSLPGA